jgi:uncharacterized protein (DUF488 family)
MPVIYTIGHSNRGLSEFLEKLKEHGVTVLVDVRSIPRSRFNPQYNQNALSKALEEQGIAYQWRGADLGGKGENLDYEGAIANLIATARGGERVCAMCSEGDYKQCHRHTMLEPSLIEHGVQVKHISYTKL